MMMRQQQFDFVTKICTHARAPSSAAIKPFYLLPNLVRFGQQQAASGSRAAEVSFIHLFAANIKPWESLASEWVPKGWLRCVTNAIP